METVTAYERAHDLHESQPTNDEGCHGRLAPFLGLGSEKMYEQTVAELGFEPCRFRRHDFARIRDGQ